MVQPFFLSTADGDGELTYANQEVPETIVKRLRCQMGRVRLDLSMCNIKKVPLEAILVHFGSQPKTLDLSFNVLQYISPSFAVEMCQISKLDLSRNEIKRLPNNFGELKKLTYLDIHGNKLQTLPLSMGNMAQLEYLRVSENPFREPIQNFLGSKCRDVSPVDLADLLVTFLKEKSVIHVENLRSSNGIRSKGKSSKIRPRTQTSMGAKGDYIHHDLKISYSEEEIIADIHNAKLPKKSAVSDSSTFTIEKPEIYPMTMNIMSKLHVNQASSSSSSNDEEIIEVNNNAKIQESPRSNDSAPTVEDIETYPVTVRSMIILMLLTILWNVVFFHYLKDFPIKYPAFLGSIWTGFFEPIRSFEARLALVSFDYPNWVFRRHPVIRLLVNLCKLCLESEYFRQFVESLAEQWKLKQHYTFDYSVNINLLDMIKSLELDASA